VSEGDEELLAGVARGDPDIWERIYRAYAKDVHATAQKELRSLTEIVDSKDVQDIVQQTFLEAMEGGVLTPDTKSISAKLRTVAARRAREAHRRASKVADQAIEDIPTADSGLDPIEEVIEAGYRREIAQAV
jgi:DNA-directed RNA polymerase specialized sigma24 family protein